MKIYELICLISPNLSETELKSIEEKIIELLQKEGGILTSEMQGKTAKKRLAYPVKKANQAYMVNLSFELNPEKLESLREKLNSIGEIIRYSLMVKKSPKITKSSHRVPKITKKASQPKVELEEIEKKLEEILGE